MRAESAGAQPASAVWREFEGHRSSGEIRACADAVESGFDGATVRSYVQVLAYRRTRECLRAERCEALLAR
jgi:citrate lyase beta subunit